MVLQLQAEPFVDLATERWSCRLAADAAMAGRGSVNAEAPAVRETSMVTRRQGRRWMSRRWPSWSLRTAPIRPTDPTRVLVSQSQELHDDHLERGGGRVAPATADKIQLPRFWP